VIPVYNRPSGLRRAVLSALEQQPIPQVIVVDDGSDDGTIDAIADLQPHAQVVRSSERVGPSAARNLGAGAATGEWLLFLDSDDVLLPGATMEFERLTDVGDVRLAMAMATFEDEEDGPRFSGLAGSFVVRHADFHRIGGYDEELRYGENADLLERLVGCAPAYGPEVAQSTTLVSTVTRQIDPGLHDVNRLNAVAHLTAAQPDYMERSAVARTHGIGTVTAARLGHRKEATRHAVLACKAEPWRPRHYAPLAATVLWPIGRRRWSR
jgi:hypothetical protein